MTGTGYADFLPDSRRAEATPAPEETWWSWCGHEVHVARARDAEAPVRVLVVHGAGSHSGALWPVASLLAARGLDVAAVDLPLYGRTRCPDRRAVRYPEWIELLTDLVRAEDDGRPLVLFGASIGGMLALEVAALSQDVEVVVATCLLDPGDPRSRAAMSRVAALGVVGRPLTRLARGPVARMLVPVGWFADLSAMSRDPALSALCASDPLGGGARVPLGFLASYLGHRHTGPERTTTEVVLVHPGRDDWTPVECSMRVLRRLSSPSRVVLLRECGHFPVEEPGLTDLLTTVDELVGRL